MYGFITPKGNILITVSKIWLGHLPEYGLCGFRTLSGDSSTHATRDGNSSQVACQSRENTCFSLTCANSGHACQRLRQILKSGATDSESAMDLDDSSRPDTALGCCLHTLMLCCSMLPKRPCVVIQKPSIQICASSSNQQQGTLRSVRRQRRTGVEGNGYFFFCLGLRILGCRSN